MLVDSIAFTLYRAMSGAVPDLVLKRIGIASSRRRPEFYTLERIVNEMPAVPGAVLECGVYRGATLLGMTHILNRRGIRARVMGFDSFEGFPEPVAKDAQDDGTLHPDVRAGALSDSWYDRLRRQITGLGWDDRIALTKGFFENTLHTISNERFSLVHLDCDLYESYKTCLEFCYPRMLPGSVIVLDDYKLPANVYPGADRAVDEFFSDKPEKPERFDHPLGLRSFVRMRRGG